MAPSPSSSQLLCPCPVSSPTIFPPFFCYHFSPFPSPSYQSLFSLLLLHSDRGEAWLVSVLSSQCIGASSVDPWLHLHTPAGWQGIWRSPCPEPAVEGRSGAIGPWRGPRRLPPRSYAAQVVDGRRCPFSLPPLSLFSPPSISLSLVSLPSLFIQSPVSLFIQWHRVRLLW